MNSSENVPEASLAAEAPAAGRAGTYRYEKLLQARLRRAKAMAPDRAVSPAHVRDVILADLDRQTGKPGDWEIDGAAIRARESWVFKARTPLAPWPLAVKVYCDAVGVELSSQQLDLLRRFHEKMAVKSGLTVPVPWAALPEHRTLIMEWIEEPRVDVLLQRAGRRRDERARLFAAAGRWLRHFHEQSGITVLPLSPKPLLHKVEMRVLGEKGTRPRLFGGVFERAEEVLESRLAQYAGTPVAHVVAHGDFVSHNLFHGSDRTVGFDIGGRQTSPVTRDIFRFLVHAESEKPFFTRSSTLAPGGIERQDLDAFLSAYGPLGRPIEQGLFMVLQLGEIVYRWAVLVDRLRRGRVNPDRIVKVFRLRRMAKRTMAVIEAG
jgi:hypothetical protein